MSTNFTRIFLFLMLPALFAGCKQDHDPSPVTPAEIFKVNSASINNNGASPQYNVNRSPVIRIIFSAPVDHGTVATGITVTPTGGTALTLNASFQNGDSLVLLQPASPLPAITKYLLEIKTSLHSQRGTALQSANSITFVTSIDSSRKFPLVSDNALLDIIEQQTFRYFWDFGHPVSGLARERSNGDNNIITIGGSGFGIMTIPAAISRNFITRAEGLTRMQTILSFLKNTTPRFHGAFAHWINGTTGAVIPFSANDNGADLVETSYLMMGLLTARQYFNGVDATETTLRNDINSLWQAVEWDWFRQNGKKVLYWHWSPDFQWVINAPIQGWNETLITYVLAASSPTHSIPRAVYDSGFARNGAMINNSVYYSYTLPLGPVLGGPLFFEHYSFMGINPNGLIDAYANYSTQTKNHTLINYTYCKINPRGYAGYSDSVWGLTASDIKGGYAASSPTNDLGFIAPTAAVSSLAYTPAESMAALKFFYYVLGDKIWKQYGFTDAFSLQEPWFADSFLAIDEGPILVMIENYRTGLLWNLFTSCPEIKMGMLGLGFTGPYL